MKPKNLESRTFLILVLVTTAAFLWLVRAFLMTVFWAVVLAVVFRPVFLRWLRLVRGRRSAAALLTTLTVILVVLVPFGLIVAAVAQQALGLYQRIASGDVNLLAPIDFLERQIPALVNFLAEHGIEIDGLRASIESAAVTASHYIAMQALSLGQGMLMFTILFALTLYLLFFFIRDGERILDGVVRALPLGDDRERRLFAKFAEVSRATLKGTLAIAAVQGFLGGLLFAILGIEAAVFWGVMMAVLSLLPVVGPSLVWGPAAILLIASGSVVEGIVLIAVGSLIVGLVDNVLRPILVGYETKMPDYVVLLSTLGGLMIFGVSGLVVGPLIAALFLVVWEMMAEEYAMPDAQAASDVAVHPPPGARRTFHASQVPALPETNDAPVP